MILHLETTTKACSVVLASGNTIIAREESDSGYSHSESITVFIEKVLKTAGITVRELDAVAVSKGPGSYMGLRIGVSVAKGLCYATGKPLIAVDTLEAMALKEAAIVQSGAGNSTDTGKTLFCPMIDARRMEVYCAVYDGTGKNIWPTAARIIDRDTFSALPPCNSIYFFGDGASKCKEVLSSMPHAFFDDAYAMSADAMVPLALQKFKNGQFEDIAYFEPFYLKDFIPGAAHVKGLR